MTDLFDPIRQCKPILGFFNEYRFLSNYHLCNCVINGIQFPSSEHAYMFQKSNDPNYQDLIYKAATPKEAKRIGSTVALRKDWATYRVIAMYNALNSKFKNKLERDMLLATDDAYLEETNTWNDKFWGVCNDIGENRLGHMLMKIRESCKQASNLHISTYVV